MNFLNDDDGQVGILIDFDEPVSEQVPPTSVPPLILEDKLHYMRLVPEFADLDEGQLSTLAAVAQCQRLVQGQTLWDLGEFADQCCVVVEGRLLSLRMLSEPVGPNSLTGAVPLMGHLPLLATDTEVHRKRPAAVVATVPSLVLLISYAALSEVLEKLDLPENARVHARHVCRETQLYT